MKNSDKEKYNSVHHYNIFNSVALEPCYEQ